jgi:hypothetical protein
VVHWLIIDHEHPGFDEVFTKCCGYNWRSLLERGDLITAQQAAAACTGRQAAAPPRSTCPSCDSIFAVPDVTDIPRHTRFGPLEAGGVRPLVPCLFPPRFVGTILDQILDGSHPWLEFTHRDDGTGESG